MSEALEPTPPPAASTPTVADVPKDFTPPGGRAWGLYLFGLLLVGAAFWGARTLRDRAHTRVSQEAIERRTEADHGQRVLVAWVTHSPTERTVLLLGESRPYIESTLYAKLSGYLRRILVDRGDVVTAGQLIAVIESPETDQQIRAAAAQQRFATVNRRRFDALVEPGIVSRSEADQARATADVAQANLAALESLRDYEVLRAPFAGTITARYADPGALVQNAAAAQTGALPVVRLSETDRLRVFVYVEQRDATLLRVGDSVTVRVDERPDALPATVSRMTHELDARSRTMLAEVDVPNAHGELVAGSFVHVELHLAAPSFLQVPVEALVLQGQRASVAVIDHDDRVHFVPVTVVDDDGVNARLAATATLHDTDRVGLQVTDRVTDGQRVQPISRPRAH